MSPKVSVLMPVYNQDSFVGHAITDIMSQTMEDLELIIIDDASHDESLDIAYSYSKLDKRIKVSSNEYNVGSIHNYNLAAKKATGDYIFIGAADDRYPADALENLLSVDADVVYGAFRQISVLGNLGECYYDLDNMEFDFELFKTDCYLTSGAMLVKRSVFEEEEGYDETFAIAADWDLSLRLCAGRDVKIVPKIVMHYRMEHINSNRMRLSEAVREDERERIRNHSCYDPDWK